MVTLPIICISSFKLSFAIKTCALAANNAVSPQLAFLQYVLVVTASENEFLMNGSKSNYIAACRLALDTAVQVV